MPYSSVVGKEWTKEILRLRLPPSFVADIYDVGVGSGTYYDLLHDIYPDAEWTGIDIWSPYFNQFDLATKYDRLVTADIRHLDWRMATPLGLWIFGDVLEHMTKEEAASVLLKAMDAMNGCAGAILISVPLGEYPQGPLDGNAHEAHVATYQPLGEPGSIEDIIPCGIAEFFEDDGIGVYLLDPDDDAGVGD